jgi:hypothetical protein
VFHDDVVLQQAGHRYLGLVGCFFQMECYRKFHLAFEALKQKHFPHNPDEPVVMHRSHMINCRGPFACLRDSTTRTAFESDFVNLIKAEDYTVIGVVIDKLALKTQYLSPFHPYHMALGFLLQRYCGYLSHFNRSGDVMAESRGGREDGILKNAYDHIYTHGDMHHPSGFYKQALTTRELKLKPKTANISGLQFADLLAYPVKQEVLLENGRVPDPGEVFGKRICAALAGRYNRHLYDGRVTGYGKILFPK